MQIFLLVTMPCVLMCVSFFFLLYCFLSLPFSISPSPFPSFLLMQDSSASERRHWNVSSEGQAYLTIARVSKEDEGSWECLELEYSGRVKQRAHILDLIVAG